MLQNQFSHASPFTLNIIQPVKCTSQSVTYLAGGELKGFHYLGMSVLPRQVNGRASILSNHKSASMMSRQITQRGTQKQNSIIYYSARDKNNSSGKSLKLSKKFLTISIRRARTIVDSRHRTKMRKKLAVDMIDVNSLANSAWRQNSQVSFAELSSQVQAAV